MRLADGLLVVRKIRGGARLRGFRLKEISLLRCLGAATHVCQCWEGEGAQ